MSLSDVFHHTVLENGNIRYDISPSIYMIEPKDYTEPVYSNFFKSGQKQKISVVNPKTLYTNEIQNVIELQGVKSLVDLVLYDADIIKIRINLQDLIGENMSTITSDVMNNFCYMEGLDSDVNIGGLDVHITPDEIVPISIKALFFCTLRIKNPDQMVTVYYSRNLPRDIGKIDTIGRFRYANGMLTITPTV